MKLGSLAAPTTVFLPPFPDDEGPFIRRLQARRDAEQLAEQLEDPLQRKVDQGTITLARRTDGSFVIADAVGAGPLTLPQEQDGADVSGVTVRGLNQARQMLASPQHAAAEADRKRAVWRAHQGRLPVAWSCDTRVYERDDKTLFAKSAVVARRTEDFGQFAVRPNAASLGRAVLVQRLFARGTYVASDVRTLGNETEKARYLAHVHCLLGPVGDQLLRDYERLPTPWQTGGHVVRWPLFLVTSVLLYGAFYASVVADSEVKTPEAESRAFHALHNVLLGCCIGYGVLGLVAASVAWRRRAEHRHIVGFRAVRESHDRLLQQSLQFPETQLAERERSRDAVVASRSRFDRRQWVAEAGHEDGLTLPLRSVDEQALEELNAYWHLVGEDAGA